jgi:hypothetical protein
MKWNLEIDMGNYWLDLIKVEKHPPVISIKEVVFDRNRRMKAVWSMDTQAMCNLDSEKMLVEMPSKEINKELYGTESTSA